MSIARDVISHLDSPPRGALIEQQPNLKRSVARGLLGRAWKDVAVELAKNLEAQAFQVRAAACLAIEHYLRGATEQEEEPLGEGHFSEHAWSMRDNMRWCAVNAATLTWWLKWRGIEGPEGKTVDEIAGIAELAAGKGTRAWDKAAIAEMKLLKGDMMGAVAAFNDYLDHPDATKFAISGTVRQLTFLSEIAPEEWQKAVEPILQRLRYVLMQTNGATMEIAGDISEKFASADDAQYERYYGGHQADLIFLRTLINRASGVCQIRRGRFVSGSIGTGFLVRGRDLRDDLPDELFVLTNSHVVASQPYPEGNILPQQASVHFSVLPEAPWFEVEEIWHDPPSALDATLLRLKQVEGGAPAETLRPYSLPVLRNLTAKLVAQDIPADGCDAKRVYVVGHPLGVDTVRISLDENQSWYQQLGGKRVLHYRLTTDRGSSGSPVLWQDTLDVIGLHHRGDVSTKLPPGGLANEAICIGAIAQAITLPLTAER